MMAGWLKNESESYLSTFYVSDDLYSVLEKAGEAKVLEDMFCIIHFWWTDCWLAGILVVPLIINSSFVCVVFAPESNLSHNEAGWEFC